MRFYLIVLVLTAILFSWNFQIALADNGWQCVGHADLGCFATEALCNASACPRSASCKQPTQTCTPDIKGWKCSNTDITQCFSTESACNDACTGRTGTSCNPNSCDPSVSGPATPTVQPPVQINLPNPLGTTGDIPGVIEKIVRFLRNLASPVVAGMVIFGAFQIIFAGGDPEKFAKGRKTILYAAIGYAIVWIGWGIADIIKNIISRS